MFNFFRRTKSDTTTSSVPPASPSAGVNAMAPGTSAAAATQSVPAGSAATLPSSPSFSSASSPSLSSPSSPSPMTSPASTAPTPMPMPSGLMNQPTTPSDSVGASQPVVPASYVDAYVPPVQAEEMPMPAEVGPRPTGILASASDSGTRAQMPSGFMSRSGVSSGAVADVKTLPEPPEDMLLSAQTLSQSPVQSSPAQTPAYASVQMTAQTPAYDRTPIQSSAQTQEVPPMPMTSSVQTQDMSQSSSSVGPASTSGPSTTAASTGDSSSGGASSGDTNSSDTSSEPPSLVSKKLEDQNIFFLLGVSHITDDEKEKFLDDLQKVIWNDFLSQDLELLLTEEEMDDFHKLTSVTGRSEEETQVAMVEFLEKLIPDLEKIMLDKALELKEDMFRERIKELKIAHAAHPLVLPKVLEAEGFLNTDPGEEDWRSAAEVLNHISA